MQVHTNTYTHTHTHTHTHMHASRCTSTNTCTHTQKPLLVNVWKPPLTAHDVAVSVLDLVFCHLEVGHRVLGRVVLDALKGEEGNSIHWKQKKWSHHFNTRSQCGQEGNCTRLPQGKYYTTEGQLLVQLQSGHLKSVLLCQSVPH